MRPRPAAAYKQYLSVKNAPAFPFAQFAAERWDDTSSTVTLLQRRDPPPRSLVVDPRIAFCDVHAGVKIRQMKPPRAMATAGNSPRPD